MLGIKKKARVICYDYRDEQKYYDLEISNGLWYSKVVNPRGWKGWYWGEIYTYLEEHNISTKNIKHITINKLHPGRE